MGDAEAQPQSSSVDGTPLTSLSFFLSFLIPPLPWDSAGEAVDRSQRGREERKEARAEPREAGQ